MRTPEARKTFKTVALGTLACTAVTAAALLLAGADAAAVAAGAAGGWAVAAANFALLCLTVRRAAMIPADRPRMAALLRVSYTARLFLQGVWCVAALALPGLHPAAGILPLLFPRLVLCAARMGENRRIPNKGEG